MRIMKTIFAGSAGLAAIAASAPAAAQYAPYNPYAQSYGYAQQGYSPQGYSPQGYSPQGYSPQGYVQQRPYGYQQQYGYNGYGAANTNVAAQQCSAAVQSRLGNRVSIGSILGAALGVNTSGRVVSITQVAPRSNGTVRVRGYASSGRYAQGGGYGPYGVGAYGASGYGYANTADLSFRCDVDYRGYVRNVDIRRR